MKFKYNKEDDVLMIELSKEPIDYAEQNGDLIVHFSPKREAVLLEILDATKWLKNMGRSIPEKIKQELWPERSISVAHTIK